MWIELHDSSRDHPKILKLARDLGIKPVYALGHVTSLWTWVLRMAPDGCLDSFDGDDIELAAQWDGEPGKLFFALKERKLLDAQKNGSLSVHDWNYYSGTLKIKERVRQHRENKKQISNVTLQPDPVTLSNVERKKERPIRQTHTKDPYDREDSNERFAEAKLSLPPSPVFCQIPLLVGKQFDVTEDLITELAEANPAVDVRRESLAARQWCLANPAKKKRNGRAFLLRWVQRAQESGGTRQQTPKLSANMQGINSILALAKKCKEENDGEFEQGRVLGVLRSNSR
jgi:hypothetical protein